MQQVDEKSILSHLGNLVRNPKVIHLVRSLLKIRLEPVTVDKSKGCARRYFDKAWNGEVKLLHPISFQGAMAYIVGKVLLITLGYDSDWLCMQAT